MTELLTPSNDQDWQSVRTLLREYAAQVGVDLCFQGFEAELAGLPGHYGPPRGAMLVARVDGELAGCCALRPLDNTDYANACEMKRLFVRPVHRGQGLGRRLATQIIHEAITLDYTVMRLDTLDGGD